MRTSEDTAMLLAVLLNRSGQSRARVSAVTIKLLADRQNLRRAFVELVIDALYEYNWILFEIRGGYGAVQVRALEAARPVTARRLLTADELRALRRDDLDALRAEVAPQHEEEEPGEEAA
jgi:hypothetical protein